MTIVRTDDLKEEMILSEDVREISGRLLLSKGQVLNSTHINTIKKWGIPEISIISEATNPPAPAVSEKEQEKIRAGQEQVKPLFRHADLDHPAVKELFRMAAAERGGHGAILNHAIKDSEESAPPRKELKDELQNKMLHNELKLPEIPSIAFELNQVLADPFCTTDNLAQIVSKSPSLTAALLKIVNSPFYGFASKIDTISRAVTIIGTREISSLALVICAVSAFKGIPEQVVGMQSFLRHSFACGLVCRLLAAKMNIPQTEQLFVAGLLHDIGRVIIYKHFPGMARALLNHCSRHEKILHFEEKALWGYEHTDLSSHLLKAWNFPPILEENIFYHHHPMDAPQKTLAGIIHLADVMVNGMGIGTSGEKYVPPLDPLSWELLKFSPNCFEPIIGQAVHQMSALESLLIN